MWCEEYSKPDFYNWGIELKDSGELIGNISVVQHDEERTSAIMGWCMGTRWWGQGIIDEVWYSILAEEYRARS